jgi:hypothetical protein
MTSGQCPWCADEVTMELKEGGDALPSLHDTRELAAYAIYRCTNCTAFHYFPVSQVLLYHPATIAFYHERGRDLTTIPKWRLRWAVTDETTEVLDRNPWRFRVRVPLDDDVLLVTLNDRLRITDVQEESAGG